MRQAINGKAESHRSPNKLSHIKKAIQHNDKDPSKKHISKNGIEIKTYECRKTQSAGLLKATKGCHLLFCYHPFTSLFPDLLEVSWLFPNYMWFTTHNGDNLTHTHSIIHHYHAFKSTIDRQVKEVTKK